MNKNNITFRLERKEDYREVENLVRDSFWNVYMPGCLEHFVLHELRNDPHFIPELDLVMERNGEIIGQIIGVEASIKCDDGTFTKVLTFGPLAIRNDLKGNGYGREFMLYVIEKAKEMGYVTTLYGRRRELPELKASLETIQKTANDLITRINENLEIILVDDGSPDNSLSVCNDLASSDSRIKVFHKENGGLCSARNLGIANATGKYIAFLDHDDEYMDGYLEDNISLIEKYNADVVKFGRINKVWTTKEDFKLVHEIKFNRIPNLKDGVAYFDKKGIEKGIEKKINHTFEELIKIFEKLNGLVAIPILRAAEFRNVNRLKGHGLPKVKRRKRVGIDGQFGFQVHHLESIRRKVPSIVLGLVDIESEYLVILQMGNENVARAVLTASANENHIKLP